jgi:hypothetical protein
MGRRLVVLVGVDGVVISCRRVVLVRFVLVRVVFVRDVGGF